VVVQFRWRFVDDSIGEQWSEWHTQELPCDACCCGGPEDGEHLEAAGYYDEWGLMESGHSRFDPADHPDWVTFELKP
jgi:hypothetical protein